MHSGVGREINCFVLLATDKQQTDAGKYVYKFSHFFKFNNIAKYATKILLFFDIRKYLCYFVGFWATIWFFLFDWLVKCKIFASMHRKNGLNRCVCKKKVVPLHAQM